MFMLYAQHSHSLQSMPDKFQLLLEGLTNRYMTSNGNLLNFLNLSHFIYICVEIKQALSFLCRQYDKMSLKCFIVISFLQSVSICRDVSPWP